MRLVQHERKRGKGAAIRTWLPRRAGGYVFFLDADLATPPEESLKLLDELEGGRRRRHRQPHPAGWQRHAREPAAQRRMVGRMFTLMRKACACCRTSTTRNVR